MIRKVYNKSDSSERASDVFSNGHSKVNGHLSASSKTSYKEYYKNDKNQSDKIFLKREASAVETANLDEYTILKSQNKVDPGTVTRIGTLLDSNKFYCVHRS